VIAVGSDADLALLDLDREETVSPALLQSDQDHTPFEGVRVRGWPRATMLRGRVVYRDGEVVGPASGEFLRRPLSGRRQAAARA
jgi:dihydropyrimidinase/allantoinase